MSERHVLVVDDEPLARQRLLRLLREIEPGLRLSEARDGLEAVERIRAERPHVVFLDVQMPGLSGFDVLGQLEARDFEVVFQTAFDEFALRAFEHAACDYLLKPFTRARLAEALTRALARVSGAERLAVLEAQVRQQQGPLRRVVARQGGRLRVLEEGEVLAFVSRDHLTCALLPGGREAIVDLSVERLAERLDPERFRSVHRGVLVRADAAVSLGTSRSGETTLELQGGVVVPVSRRQKAEARRLLQAR